MLRVEAIVPFELSLINATFIVVVTLFERRSGLYS